MVKVTLLHQSDQVVIGLDKPLQWRSLSSESFFFGPQSADGVGKALVLKPARVTDQISLNHDELEEEILPCMTRSDYNLGWVMQWRSVESDRTAVIVPEGAGWRKYNRLMASRCLRLGHLPKSSLPPACCPSSPTLLAKMHIFLCLKLIKYVGEHTFVAAGKRWRGQWKEDGHAMLRETD
ncbi:hypothetical protein TRIUR3_16184 [Triticum urartu]|uniref:Uncharacterized protein n=1 Tax=Triticum urartu TaxID=4572 RepID=M7YYE0_TRIUA|nr:hypothetical protein TRIUR3_16184 [Triticum urartu]